MEDNYVLYCENLSKGKDNTIIFDIIFMDNYELQKLVIRKLKNRSDLKDCTYIGGGESIVDNLIINKNEIKQKHKVKIDIIKSSRNIEWLSIENEDTELLSIVPIFP